MPSHPFPAARRMLIILAALVLAVPMMLSTSPRAAAATHYYVLIGGTCDGDATVYNGLSLNGGVRLHTWYPAGATGLPGPCGETPMDVSVNIGHDNYSQLLRDHYDPAATYTIVGYSQGAIVANRLLNDIADGRSPVQPAQTQAKLYADPMQPGSPERWVGVGALGPSNVGIAGYYFTGPGRWHGEGGTGWGAVDYVRYCIATDGVCHSNTPESLGGYQAQHWCYRAVRPSDARSIMGDSIADGFFNNDTVQLPKQDCKTPTGQWIWGQW